VNWQKTKVQALCCREDMPLTIKVPGHDLTLEKLLLGFFPGSRGVCIPWLSYPLSNRKHL